MELWKDNEASNIVNYCWVTKEEKLYHSIENGQVSSPCLANLKTTRLYLFLLKNNDK